MSVSVQQASTNSFVAYLQAALPDVAISSRWPGKQFPGKAITVIPAGQRQDTPIEPKVVKQTNQGATQTAAYWLMAACFQPYQLDVWSDSYLSRDDIIARLDIALRVGTSSLPGVGRDPIGNGCSIAVGDGWDITNTIAKFRFTSPDINDTPDSIQRSQYRATLRGGANVMLTVPTVTPRQKILKLSLLLDGVLSRDEYIA